MLKFFKHLNKIKSFILDILFPIECLGCGKEDIWVCKNCFRKIKFGLVDRCVVCKKPSEFGATHQECKSDTALNGIIIACVWEDKLLQDLIHKFKYNFIQNLSYPLAQILITKMKAWRRRTEDNYPKILVDPDLIIVPVPLHKKRLLWRGFNQAELLADKVANYFNWQIRTDIIIRKKHTKSQVKLKRKKRLQNIKNAFEIKINQDNNLNLKNYNILLVDDILTTGSTMNECARVLKNNGAENVWGMVLARG